MLYILLSIAASYIDMSFYYIDSNAETFEEFQAYDAFNLVGEVGGALGLFLGTSLLDLSLALKSFFNKAGTFLCQRYKTQKT